MQELAERLLVPFSLELVKIFSREGYTLRDRIQHPHRDKVVLKKLGVEGSTAICGKYFGHVSDVHFLLCRIAADQPQAGGQARLPARAVGCIRWL